MGRVPLDSIVEGSNVRRFYGEIGELADSIDASMWVQPLSVRPLRARAGNTGGARYAVVQGYRRRRALIELVARHVAKARPGHDCQCGGDRCRWLTVPVEILEVTDLEALTITALENLRRKDLHFIELAGAFDRFRQSGLRTAEIAARLGYSEKHVSNCLRVLDHACPELKQRLERGQYFPAQVLFRWATLNDTEQTEELSRWLRQPTRPHPTGGRPKKSRALPRSRALTLLALLRKAAAESEQSEVESARLAGMVEGLELALGMRRRLKL